MGHRYELCVARTRRSSRTRFLAAAAGAATVVLLGASTALAWQSVKYWNAPLRAGHKAQTLGYASRQWNKVWRPIAYNFGLGYSGYRYVYDAWNNPFVDNRNAVYAQAACLNASASLADPVACLTTRP